MAQHTTQQLEVLFGGIHRDRVKSLKGMAYVEAWDVRRWLNRIYGFGGWDLETLELTCVATNSVPNGDRWKHTVVYRAQVRLTIKDTDGQPIAHYEDAASGDGINQPNLGDAHDMAMKTALSQAVKRVAVNLGDQFGLSLYNNGDPRPVVNRSVAYEGADPVSIGEGDEPVQSEPVATDPYSTDDMSNLSDGDLHEMTGHDHAEVAEAAQREVVRRLAAAKQNTVQNRTEPSENVRERPTVTPEQQRRNHTWQAMRATAEAAHFADALPGQFQQSFGKPIEQGTVEEWIEATRLMKESCA